MPPRKTGTARKERTLADEFARSPLRGILPWKNDSKTLLADRR
jgi:hypothetical protein